MTPLRLARFVLAVALSATAFVSVQAQGTIRGHVRSERTGEPVVGGTVLVVGTRIGAIVDTGGAYVIENVPAGPVKVRARFIGFSDAEQAVTIADGATRVVDFRLTDAITTLGEVRSEAKASEREVFEERPNLGVTILTGKVISTVPRLGEVDLLRAAQMLPGVMARNDFSAGLNVRGGEADQNLILLDGYPIFNPFHLGGLFGTFIDGAVQGLSLRTGGFGAPYGGRLSSVLDVQSTEETRPGTHGSATISMLASSGTVASSFANGRGTWMVSGRRTYADKVLAAFGQNSLPYYFLDGQAHVTYRLTQRTSIAATLYNGRDDLTGDLASANESADGGGFRFFWSNRVAGTTLTHDLTDSLRLVQRASYTIFKTGLDLAGGSFILDNQVRETTVGGSLEYRHGAHRPAIGYELSRDDIVYVGGSPAASVGYLDDQYHPSSAAGYANDVWKPSDRWLVEGGLRYEALKGSNWAAVSPRLSTKYFVTKDFALSAAVGRYSQWLHSLAREDIPVRLFDFWTASDTGIPVSRATHFVLGGESWFGPSRFARLETYVKNYDRLLEPNPYDDPAVHGDEYQQITGRSYGADLLLRQLERGRWGGWLAYTYTFSTRTGDLGVFYPGQDRRNNVNLLASYRMSPKYLLSGRIGYASGTPFTDIVGAIRRRVYDINTGRWDSERRSDDVEAVGGDRNAGRMPSTRRLDVTLTREGEHVNVMPFFSIINVSNAHNVFMYQFDFTGNPPTRTAYSQLPFLPTFGLSIKW